LVNGLDGPFNHSVPRVCARSGEAFDALGWRSNIANDRRCLGIRASRPLEWPGLAESRMLPIARPHSRGWFNNACSAPALPHDASAGWPIRLGCWGPAPEGRARLHVASSSWCHLAMVGPDRTAGLKQPLAAVRNWPTAWVRCSAS